MKKTDKVKCGKCGREFLANGISKHFANCKGPDAGKTGPKCPVCGKATKSDKGLEVHLCKSACGEKLKARSGPPPVAAKPKRKYTRRGKAVDSGKLTGDNAPTRTARAPHCQLPTVNHPLPPAPPASYPSPALATMGHAFIRLAELLGLAEILADYPHPEGLVLVNTQTGKQALITAAGEIEAVELTRRPKA